jgi:hypothetical protein
LNRLRLARNRGTRSERQSTYADTSGSKFVTWFGARMNAPVLGMRVLPTIS